MFFLFCAVLSILKVIHALPVAPYALHQLVEVDVAGSSLIRLKAYDPSTPNLRYTITSLPAVGKLYQLSQVFSNYGNSPIAGQQITSVPMNVTGSNNRVYYMRPSPDSATNNMWDSFAFSVTNLVSGVAANFEGTVSLVPSSGSGNVAGTSMPAVAGALVSSQFLLSNEGWSIVGNKKLPGAAGISYDANFEAFSRAGSMLNHYVTGADNLINLVESNDSKPTDGSLWYFQAPQEFLGNWGIAYGPSGSFSFTIGSFSGDFSRGGLNTLSTPAVILECATCVGPVTKGLRVVYPLSTLLLKQPLQGSTTRFNIPLVENSGWQRDPQNTLISNWPAPTQCEMLQVLAGLTSVKILGDWTNWYETVALDNVIISNTKTSVPICASSTPDASVCTC